MAALSSATCLGRPAGLHGSPWSGHRGV